MKFALWLQYAGTGAIVGFLCVVVKNVLDRFPEGDVGNGCTASIVWQPINKHFDPICGVEIDVRRINKNFVYVKTCQ